MTSIDLPSIFVPFVGLVFLAIAMVSLFLHVKKNKIFLDSMEPNLIHSFFVFQNLDLDHNTDIHLI